MTIAVTPTFNLIHARTPRFAELDCARAEKGVKQGPTTSPNIVNPPENGPQPPVYRVGDLVVDTGRATVARDGQVVALPKLTFDLLLALIEAAPRVVSHDELMQRVWPGLVVGPETVSQRVKLLRASLDDDPKSPRYVIGVRGRGYRLLPEVERPDVVRHDPPGASDAAAPATVAPAAARPWRRTVLLAAAAALVAAVGIGILVSRMNSPDRNVDATPAAPLPARSVAVLAFEDRGSAEGTDFLAEGIPENVLHQLGRFPGLTVIARGSSFAFRDSDEDLRSIGRKLNVRYLLEGSVQTAGEQLRVTSSLVDAETGASIWSMKFERPLRDVFAVEDEIAAEVARAMKISIDEGTAALAARGRDADRNFDAYLSFLRGRALHASQRLTDLPAAIDSLSAAIRQDPQFAEAYVLLARARVELADRESPAKATAGLAAAVENALQLLDTAIELEPANGEAYVERGWTEGLLRHCRGRCGLPPRARTRAEFRARLRRTGGRPVPERGPPPGGARHGGEGAPAEPPRTAPRRRQGDLSRIRAGRCRAGNGDPPAGAGARPALRPGARSPRGISLEPPGPERGDHSPGRAGREARPGQRAGLVSHRRRLTSMPTIPCPPNRRSAASGNRHDPGRCP